jgi:hypothetical protein
MAKVRKAIDNPYLLIGEARKFARKLNTAYHQRMYSDAGRLAIEEDWDNLIILDACRYKEFKEQNTQEGELSKFESAASQSWEFMQKNFVNRELHDTVYVSANPFTPRIEDGVFHSLISLLDDWDEEEQTVLPETVVERALEVNEEYPNKRLIVHFMQPHYPFLGPTGQSIDHRGYHTDDDEPNVWEILQWRHEGYGNFDEETVRQAYRENVDIAIDAAGELIDELTGKSVVTADHGALIGERLSPIPVRGYGHSVGIRVPEVTEVPWFVPEYTERKKITRGEPEIYDEVDQEIVEERLQSFGYM